MTTVNVEDLGLMAMSVNNNPRVVILGNNVHRYVGIGWVNEGPATNQQKQMYPKVTSKK